MNFDYDKVIKDLTKGTTILSIDGRYVVKRILEYLKECPFVEVVAMHMNTTDVGIYNKLKYHLDDKLVAKLYDDLKKRRKLEQLEFKKSQKRKLEVLDEIKSGK